MAVATAQAFDALGGTPSLVAPLPELSKRSIIATVARRSGRHVIEASVIPAVLFYTSLVFIGLEAAYVAALTWSYSALGRRLVRRLPVPPILVLSVIAITVRTLVAVISQSSFVYFFQPVLGAVAMGCVFLATVWIGQPLIGRLADEFWELTPEEARRPAVLRLFRHLTLLWGLTNLATAALTLTFLLWLPLGPFLVAKQASGMGITAGAVYVTVSLSLRTARREGLVAAKRARF